MQSPLSVWRDSIARLFAEIHHAEEVEGGWGTAGTQVTDRGSDEPSVNLMVFRGDGLLDAHHQTSSYPSITLETLDGNFQARLPEFGQLPHFAISHGQERST